MSQRSVHPYYYIPQLIDFIYPLLRECHSYQEPLPFICISRYLRGHLLAYHQVTTESLFIITREWDARVSMIARILYGRHDLGVTDLYCFKHDSASEGH